MIETALKNLKLLNFGIDYYQDKYLIPEGIQLSLISKDNFDPINNLQLLEYPVFRGVFKIIIPNKIICPRILSNLIRIHNLQLLEYPVYFTYNQVLNEISDNCALTYKQKKYLLNLIEESLDNLCELVNNHDNHDYDKKNILNQIIHNIDNRFDIVKEKTIVTRCEFMFLFFDDLVDAFHEVSKYLHITPFTPEDEGDEDDEEDNEKDKDNKDDNININKLD